MVAVQSRPHVPSFAGRLPQWRENPKPVLFATDVDETLIHWQRSQQGFDQMALNRNARAIRAAYPHMAVMLNTGRGLTSMQQAVLKTRPILAKIPVDYLSLNNGQELYVNKRHQRADKWILSLKEADREPGWAMRVSRTTGWDPAIVHQVRTHVLKEAGFTRLDAPELASAAYQGIESTEKIIDGRRYILQYFGTQPGIKLFALTPEGRQVFDRQAKAVGTEILGHVMAILQDPERLQAVTGKRRSQPMRVQSGFMALEDGNRKVGGIFTLLPAGIHKGSVIQEVLDYHMKAPQAVITAGDHHYNDTDAMAPAEYAGKKPGTCLPNLPIVSGGNTHLAKSVAHNPHTETVPKGRLDGAIVRQLAKLGHNVDYVA